MKYIVFALCSLAGLAHAETLDWKVDNNHSRVGFMVRHLGISKVRGEFKDYSANIKADKDGKITELEASAKTASIDTGIKKRDTHLKSDDFFNADKYPEIKLKMKSIKWKDKTFTADVDVTIRDVTKTIKFSGELLGTQKVNFGAMQQRAAYTATGKLNRKDFGLKWNQMTEGVVIVADEINIEIESEIYAPLAATNSKS
jgi:polyisoprenoid-binding protein YceI